MTAFADFWIYVFAAAVILAVIVFVHVTNVEAAPLANPEEAQRPKASADEVLQ